MESNASPSSANSNAPKNSALMTENDPPLNLLDCEEEWVKFSEPLPSENRPSSLSNLPPDRQIWQSSIVIDGMHCAACAANVENALRKTKGVVSAEVNAATHRAHVVWQAWQTKPSLWIQALIDVGYGARPAVDSKVIHTRKKELRLALWRWLVAGLCMMQVMMYAMPEYVSQGAELSNNQRQLLRWASWTLTLPVILFSCKPFFTNALADLRHKRISMDLPVALGMLLAFVVSSLGTFDPNSHWGKEVYFDSLTMFVFFLLSGRWLELKLRDRTAGAIESLMNRLPQGVLRQNAITQQWEHVLISRLVEKDKIRVQVGEAFAADGLILQGSTQVDEALLTGESTPIAKNVGDEVIAGSYNLGAVVDVQVQRVGNRTRFAKIIQLMEQASMTKPHVAQLADRLAKPFLIIVLLLAAGVMVYGWRDDPSHALMTAVSVLIVTCPCALSLATPAAMLAAAGSFAKKGILVRSLQAIETLAHVDTLIFDKTGTLTENGLKLHQVTTRSGISSALASQIAAAIASNSLHPISKALIAHIDELGLEQLPLQIESKVESAGQGITAQIAGMTATNPAVKSLGPQTYRWGSAAFCGVNPLQITSPQAHLADDEGWVASFEFIERVRSSAASTVIQLKEQSIDVQLLSGDSQGATTHLAKRLHISKHQGLCTPDSKLSHVKHLQQQAHCVGMVGDGLNDAPVLAGADVSFAFGSAVPLTQSKSDFVVMSSNLNDIAKAIAHARRTMKVVKENLIWALVYNAIAVPLAIMGLLPAWLAGLGMASSSLIVVGNAMRLRTLH